MHPAASFHWTDRAEMVAFVKAHSFVTLVDASLLVAQAPVLVDDRASRLRLHLSRGNPLSRQMPTRVVMIATGVDGYVSPDWYARPDQVPTWNYESVEITGTLAPTDDADLSALLDDLSAEHEARLPDKRPWTMDKLTQTTREALMKGIVGATLTIETIRGTRKLSQNKPKDDFDGVVRALAGAASPRDRELAAQMSRVNSRRVF